jgi:hypothetical protein
MKKFTQYNEETKSIGTGQNTDVVKTQGQVNVLKKGQDVDGQVVDAQYTVQGQGQTTDVAKTQDVKTQGEEQKVKNCKYITMDLISMLKDIQQQNKKYYELIKNLEKQSQQTSIQQNTQTQQKPQQTALPPKQNTPIQNT